MFKKINNRHYRIIGVYYCLTDYINFDEKNNIYIEFWNSHIKIKSLSIYI